MEGHKNIADTWTASRRSTFLTSRPGSRGTGTRALTLACNTQDRQEGPLNTRKDFKPTMQALASLRQEQGRNNSYSPKNERTRQRPFDQELYTKLEWMSQKQNWWHSQWSGHQGTQWRDHQWQDHDWSGVSVRNRKLLCDTDQQDYQWKDLIWKIFNFFHTCRVQTLANVVHSTVCEDRTPRRTHIFSQSCRVAHARAHLIMQTCAWLKCKFSLTGDV